MKRLALLFIVFLLTGCAAKQRVDFTQAQTLWQKYLSQVSPAASPFQDSLSMRFGKEGDTRRVTAQLWGNGDKAVRLDIMAGIGATVAMIAQREEHFLMYAPIEGKACFYDGPRSPLLKLGIPLPFSLFHLEAILHGRYTQVFGKEFARVEGASQLGISYALFENDSGGSLTLDENGKPVFWEGKGWTLRLSYDEQGAMHRLDLANSRGDKGILLMKEHQTVSPFPEEKLSFKLPATTLLLPIEEYQRRY